MLPSRRALLIAMALSVGLAGLSGPAIAAGDDSDARHVGSIDVTIADEHIHVSDVEVSGDGLPSLKIDERTYEIDSTSVSIDGATVSSGDRTYEVGGVDLELRNVGVTLEDVSINAEN